MSATKINAPIATALHPRRFPKPVCIRFCNRQLARRCTATHRRFDSRSLRGGLGSGGQEPLPVFLATRRRRGVPVTSVPAACPLSNEHSVNIHSRFGQEVGNGLKTKAPNRGAASAPCGLVAFRGQKPRTMAGLKVLRSFTGRLHSRES